MRERLLSERHGPVLLVRIDNPPRNYLTLELLDDLLGLLRGLRRDDSVRAVVFTGAPEGQFLTHLDIDELIEVGEAAPFALSHRAALASARMAAAISALPGGRALLDRTPLAGTGGAVRLDELQVRMHRLDKVVIAAVNGTTLGGGWIFAQACDLRYVADAEIRVGVPEMRMGLPPAGAIQRLVRAVGTSRALELMLEGALLTPREALEAGLANRVVEPESLLEEALAAASRLAARPPVGVRELKRAVYEGAWRPLAASTRTSRAAAIAAMSRPEAVSALARYRALLGGRSPSDGEIAAAWERLT